jgi:hypothetical protein
VSPSYGVKLPAERLELSRAGPLTALSFAIAPLTADLVEPEWSWLDAATS